MRALVLEHGHQLEGPMRMCAQGIDNVGASAQDKRMNTTTAADTIKRHTHSIRGKGRELRSHTCWAFVYDSKLITCQRSKADAIETIARFDENKARWAK